MASVLILVNLQQDFMPGGVLPVPGARDILPRLRTLQQYFSVILAIGDWHPSTHVSFAINHPGKKSGDVININGLSQRLWPVHCVQDTPGAALAPELDLAKIQKVFMKGVDPEIDSYSGFFDHGERRSTGLYEYLQEHGYVSVYVAGVTLERGVKYTALDARRLGFDCFVILDCCRGIEFSGDDMHTAVCAMQKAGVKLISSSALLPSLHQKKEVYDEVENHRELGDYDRHPTF